MRQAAQMRRRWRAAGMSLADQLKTFDPTRHRREGPLEMSATYLKIYRGPEETSAPTLAKSSSGKACVTVALSEVLPLLADAANSRRTWLEDFEDDEVTISADLYEVLLAYQYYRRPSA